MRSLERFRVGADIGIPMLECDCGWDCIALDVNLDDLVSIARNHQNQCEHPDG